MVKFIAVAWGVFAGLYAWTWEPVYLVPLLSGVVFLVARAVETRLRSSGRWTDADDEREVRRYWFLLGTIGMGTVALVLAVISFSAEGRIMDGLIYGAFSLAFFGRWAYRKARREMLTPGRAAEPVPPADRPRE